MARPRKYSRKALTAAVAEYFDSITREVVIQERVPTGNKDSWGHDVYEFRNVENNLGQVAKRTEFLVPPTIEGLCLHLGINSSTWSRWRDSEQYPEYQQVIALVDEKIIGWLKEQVSVRDKVTGVVWLLEVNHGVGKEQKEKNAEVTVVIEGGDPGWRS